MGFKGAKPFCESLSTFFSEESRGPSRPERQMKRILRGKSQAEKGEKTREKSRAHKAHGGQTASRQSAKAAIKHAGRETRPRNAGKEKPQKADMTAGSLTHSRAAAAPPCTPVRRAKQRQQKSCTHKRTAGKRQADPSNAGEGQKQQAAAQARHKSRNKSGRK